MRKKMRLSFFSSSLVSGWVTAALKLDLIKSSKQRRRKKTRVLIMSNELMEAICNPSNLNSAFRQVKRNKGAAGVDRLTIEATEHWLRENNHAREFRQQLLEGNYQPQAIRGVKIPKADGSERQLGMPTVLDRWIQQAIAQVLTPMYEPQFSSSSYGFRPKRSAHDAIKQASAYVKSGKVFVVDVDLEKYFDSVNHDRLMSRLSQDIKDKRVLKLIRRYLTADLLQNGMVEQRQKGAPQGGPLSPLLSNIVLDELDKELEKRGHSFCRYADDCNIYVSSQAAAERVMASVKGFIEGKLKLKVNDLKSACALVSERQFLGYRIYQNGDLALSPKTQVRMKRRVRELTYRNRGRAFECIISELNQYLRGWLHYFRLARIASLVRSLDEWIRRRLRCYRLKQRKRSYSIASWIISLGVKTNLAWQLATSSKSWWRLSRNPVINQALPNAWFKKQGLYSLLENYELLNLQPEPPYATNACTVV
jgi:group II intron reverse transcriptase/maturase